MIGSIGAFRSPDAYQPYQAKGKGEGKSPGQLSPEEQAAVEELARTDAKVRAHEQAHLAAAGSYATGGATYQYQQGPDGRRYAVGGEVGIDTSPVSGDPRATIRKAEAIQAAANAPSDPSSQDRAVAAAAAQMAAQAYQELSKAATGSLFSFQA